MSGPQSAMVFFSTGESKEAFFDADRRRETVERGVQSILSNIEGIHIVRANDFSCTVSVTGNPEAIVRLQDYVKHEALGTVELSVFEQPAFRAAGGW
jgi:hypothetical protein